jgi:protein-disulfide isomerase
MPTRASGAKGKPAKQSYRDLQRKRVRRNRMIAVGMISLAAIVVVALLIISNRPIGPGDFVVPKPLPRPLVNGTSTGDPSAPIKVEEFSDFRCTHCAAFWRESEPRLIQDYVATGKVYFTYKPFSFISDESFLAAEAAYCALDQGKFWEFHDYIFANFEQPMTEKLLRAFAQDLKLDMKQYDSCMSSHKYRQQVQDDVQYGRNKNITGTPTFDVNGKLVSRVELFSAIDEALAAAPQP